MMVRGAADFLKGGTEELVGTNERCFDRMGRLRDLLFGLSEKERGKFIDHFLEFAEVTIKMRSEESFRKMAKLRGKEGTR